MLPTLLKFLHFYTQAPTFPNQWSFISPNKMLNQHITITALAVPTGYHLQAGLFLHSLWNITFYNNTYPPPGMQALGAFTYVIFTNTMLSRLSNCSSARHLSLILTLTEVLLGLWSSIDLASSFLYLKDQWQIHPINGAPACNLDSHDKIVRLYILL